MAYKISFKFDRSIYNGTEEQADEQIKNKIQKKLNELKLNYSRQYKPSRDSITILFPSEDMLNKVLDKFDLFKAVGFEPKIMMALKAARTVYCHSFDPTLLLTYTHNKIKELLIQDEWDVKNVYIMNSKKSFKIEFKSTKQAQMFTDSISTSIGGIRLRQESKELEIDPTVRQCWTCGVLEPKHNSINCPGPERCLKCNSSDHQFHACSIPKDIHGMSTEQKAQRFCIPCQSRGDHTSLDHRFCSEKRKIIHTKIKDMREIKNSSETNNKRDINLIKKTLEISNTHIWPSLQASQQESQKTSTIVLLSILDEFAYPGTFNDNLENSLKENGLPPVKYNLQPLTAKKVANLMCGTRFTVSQQPQPHLHHPQAHAQQKQPQPHPHHSQSHANHPQPHAQQKSHAQHPSHSQKMPIHKFCVDTSKHLTKQPKSLMGKTPIPNKVVREIPAISSTHTRSELDLSRATVLADQTISTLRNLSSATNNHFEDDSSLSITDDEILSQTPSYHEDNLSLEDYQPQTGKNAHIIGDEPYLSCPKCDYKCADISNYIGHERHHLGPRAQHSPLSFK